MHTTQKVQDKGVERITNLDDASLIPPGDGGLRLHVEVCLVGNVPPRRHIRPLSQDTL